MSRFESERDIERRLKNDPGVQAVVKKAALEAKVHAQRFAKQAGAPWMRRRGSQTIEVKQYVGGVRVMNTDYAGHLMEWGSKNNPPHAPLRRGVRAAGLDLERHGK